MGRRVPASSSLVYEAHPSFRTAAILTLAFAWAAATIAIVVSLCAAFRRSKNSSTHPPSSPSSDSKESHDQETATTATGALEQQQQQHDKSSQQKEGLELPNEEPVTVIDLAPGVATHGPLPPTVLPASTSKRRLSISLTGKMKVGSKKLDRFGKRSFSVTSSSDQDTLWKKSIILGEKCKVGSGDADEEEVTVLDENGNPRRFYQPMKSRAVSRANSLAFSDGMPNS